MCKPVSSFDSFSSAFPLDLFGDRVYSLPREERLRSRFSFHPLRVLQLKSPPAHSSQSHPLQYYHIDRMKRALHMRKRAGLSTSSRSRLFDEFAFDVDLDFIADNPLAIKQGVKCHAEIFPIDLTFGAIPDTMPHMRIIEFAVLHYSKRYRSGGALNGQITGQRIAILASRFDFCAFESHGWMGIRFQKIRGAQ